MANNVPFQEFSFYEEIDSNLLEYLFESAWDTLQKKYPTATLNASDCFVITIHDNISDIDDTEYSGTNFSLGQINGQPAILNIKTKEVINILLNKRRWYQHS